MRSALIAGVVLAALAPLTVLPAADPKDKEQFDPARLADMPDNSWLDLGLSWRGGHEIPAVFDEANQLFFKYGGCGDQSPRVNIDGSPRPNETYGNSCWVVNFATGKWEMRRPRDVSFPADRPGNGCSRCFAYDSKRKLVWMYGGISNGGGGGNQWDLWTYDGAKDAFKPWHVANPPRFKGDAAPGDVFVYDSVHDLLLMPWGDVTRVYDPAKNAWEDRKTPDGPVKPGHYASMAFDANAKMLVFPRAARTGKTAEKLEAGMNPSLWRPSEKGYHEYEFQTWTYDPEKNQWSNRKPDRTPEPGYRNRFGLAYDAKNQVVILIGGSSDTWDSREENLNDVWIYETARNTWTKMTPAGSKPTVRSRECRHCAYDPVHNVVLFHNANGPLWAYRYKK